MDLLGHGCGVLRLEGDAPGVGWPHGSTVDIVSPWLGCFDIGIGNI